MNDSVNPNPPPAIPPPPVPPPPSAGPPATPLPAYDRKSPGLAGVLSMFPGLGHLYLGLYQRAFAFAGAFCILIFFNTHGHRLTVLSGPATFFLWVFAIIDAVRQARAINQGRLKEGGWAPEEQLVRGGQGTAGLTFGVIMVGLGALWLIDRYVDIDWSFMDRWGGPAILILLGVVLIATHVAKKRREHANGVGFPPRSQ
jgi:hypothetical protein